MYNENLVVTVKCKGKILREKKGIVYLPFGSEYSILMKNLSTKRALVGIEIDGESVINGKLIIEPNSTMELERYVKDLNVGNRFKFIEKTDKISEHRGDRVDDGIIRVTYQFEKEIEYVVTKTYISRETCPYNSPYCVFPYLKHGIGYCNGCSYYNKPVEWYTISTGGSYIGGVNVEVYSSDSLSYSAGEGKPTLDSLNYSNVEEGITVPGSGSNQQFAEGSIGNLESKKHILVLQLKGESGEEVVRTPITVSTRILCVTCGRSNSSRYNYCTECGTALEIY